MEENRRFSWSNLFIKVIIVIIFVLFTVWLLSLSNKDLSTSLNVLTDNIFSQNVEKMKNVGKEYFTTERLPKKIGEVKTLTLEKMYEKKLILELKDKHGKACDPEDSYISIEKMETEYQMKVKLECGEEDDYIIVIMGCYDYCDTDICEKKEDVIISDKGIEYEYKKTTGGYWTDYGKWSEWSKVAVTKNDYRQVETKVEKEDYSYNKTITETVYAEFEASCPSGYKKTSDGSKCYKEVSTTSTKNPTCPTVSGYTLVGRDGFDCSYSKTTTNKADPTCPTVSGYTLTGRDGFTCSYSKTTTNTADPTCPTVSGYTYTGRNGFTCNYSKTTTSTADLICPTVSGYTYTGRSGSTCNYSKTVKTPYQVEVVNKKTCYSQKVVKPCSSCAPVVQNVPYDCSTTSYETRYKTTTETTTKTAYCPDGYSKSGSSCVKSTTTTTTKSASCPSGYTQSGNSCVKSVKDTTTKTASCPSGYSKSGSSCVKSVTSTTTKSASCPSGYTKSGSKCSKTTTKNEYEDLIKSCPSGYSKTKDGNKCYKEVPSTVKVSGTKEVIYYRYRVREYIGGTTDYKWSTSKEDKKLLDAGYKLTGRTR